VHQDVGKALAGPIDLGAIQYASDLVSREMSFFLEG
jgi:hypothetical protein